MAYTEAEDAIIDCLALSAFGTHEATVAKAYDLPLLDVEQAAAKLLADETLVRSATGVLWLSAKHGDRLMGHAPWPDGTTDEPMPTRRRKS
jgi:hypothetical protein